MKFLNRYYTDLAKKVREPVTYIAIRAIMLVMIAVIVKKSLVYDDWFWHVRSGEWVLKNGFIHNILFAWDTGDVAWIAHEWLFGVFSAVIDGISHNLSVRVYIIATLVLFFILFRYVRSQDGFRENMTRDILLIIEIAGYCCMVNMRPQYLDILLLVTEVILLEKSVYRKNGEKLLFVMPLIMLLWVNFHMGTAILMLFIFLVYLICNFFSMEIGRISFTKAPVKWRTYAVLAFALTLAAAFLNPYGIEGVTYAFHNMGDQTMLTLIREWHAPDSKNIVLLLFYTLPMFLNFVSFAAYRGKIRATDIALYSMFSILYLRSVRFGSTLCIAGILFTYRYGFDLKESMKCFGKGKKKRQVPAKGSRQICAVVSVLCAVWIIQFTCTTSFADITGNRGNADTTITCSNEVVDAVLKDQPERIYNDYDIGGYLIYHGISPFMYQCYEPFVKSPIYEDYLLLCSQYGADDIEDINRIDALIEKYDFDGYLILKGNYVLEDKILATGRVSLEAEDGHYRYYRVVESDRKEEE